MQPLDWVLGAHSPVPTIIGVIRSTFSGVTTLKPLGQTLGTGVGYVPKENRVEDEGNEHVGTE